jgi:hypothetical protein
MQKFVGGKGISEIGREENRNRETVARIVHSDEMQEHVNRAREALYGFTDIALSTLRHAIETERNGVLAYKLLTDISVIPTSLERMQNLASKGSDGEGSQLGKIYTKMLVHAVMNGRTFGFDVSAAEEAIAKAGARVDDDGNLVPITEAKES